MKLWFSMIMLLAIIGGLFSFIWFIFGATAHFQRGMDIIGTAYLGIAGIPILIFIIIFIYLIIKKWVPQKKSEHILIYTFIIIMIILSIILFKSVSIQGWTNETIEKDSLKVTSDHKYEYQIELINLFRRDSYAQLYVKNVESGQEDHIKVAIKANEIVGLGVAQENHWVDLLPTESKSQYLLKTTDDLGIPEESFTIDVEKGISKKIE